MTTSASSVDLADAEPAQLDDATPTPRARPAWLVDLAERHQLRGQVDPPDSDDAPDESNPVDDRARTALRILRTYIQADRPSPATTAALDALDVLVRMVDSADALLAPATVADQLGVSVHTVYRLVASRELAAVRLGHRTLRIPARSLVAYRGRLATAGAPGTG